MNIESGVRHRRSWQSFLGQVGKERYSFLTSSAIARISRERIYSFHPLPMNKQSKMLVAAAMIASLSAGALGVGTSFAASNPGTTDRGMSGLVAAIAQKFNLDSSAVQAVFDAQHQQMSAQHAADMQVKIKTTLSAAVTAGKLTQAQADLITAKHAELKTAHESLQGKTKAEIQAAMKTQHDALQAWAKANNIPKAYLQLGGPGGKGGHGPEGMGGFGERGEKGFRGPQGKRAPAVQR